MRRFLVAVGVIVVLLVGAVLVVPSVIDWNSYKGEIAAAAEQATGRKLTIEGDLSARLLPSPELTARGIRLANAAGAEAPAMVDLRAVEVQAAFWPLLTGTVQVKSIRLVEPVVAFEVLADGKANWEFGAVAPAGTAPGPAAAGASGGGPAIRLEKLTIVNGSVSYRDAASATKETVEKLDLDVTAGDLAAGPFTAKGKLWLRGQPATLDINVGRLDSRPIPASVQLELERARLALRFRGTLSEPADNGRLVGRIEIEAPDLRGASSVIASLAKTDLPVPPGAQALQVRAAVEAGKDALNLSDLTLALGESRGTGTLNVGLGAKTNVAAALKFARLDLDPWLATAGATANAAARPTGAAPRSAPAAAPAMALPRNLDVSVSIAVDSANLRGGSIRQVALDMAMRDGQLDLRNLTASLPGNADVAVSGRLAGTSPQFDGKLEATTPDLRGVLGWLNVATDKAPADRLRQFSFQSTIRATPELVQLAGIDLRVDAARLTGGAAYALRARPSFSLDLAIDRLNADAYMALAGGASATAAPTTRSSAPGGASRPGPATDTLGLAFLDDFDAAVKLSVQQLAYAQTRGRDLRLDASLIGGRLTVREARVGEIAGAAFAANGTVENFAASPTFNLAASAAAGSPNGIARLFGASLPFTDSQLGQVEVKGTVRGGLDRIGIDLDARIGRMAAKTQGLLDLTGASARSDVTVSLTDPSYVHLARLAGAAIVPVPAGADGPIEVRGTVKGGLDALNVDLGVKFANAELTAAGALRGLGAEPSFGLATRARHPDLSQFLRALGIDYRPAATNLGALRLSADINGSAKQIKIASLDAGFGPVNMTGDAALGFDGARPKLTGNLSASEILLDLFMPRAGGGAAAAGGPARPAPGAAVRANERWSRDPIDLAVLRTFDADLNLRARGLTYGAYAFAEPTLAIRLNDGNLAVDPLTGRLFDGTVTLKLNAVTAGQVPRIATSVALSGANIERALREAAGLGEVTGRFDMTGELAAAGRSQFDMISNLSGRANFAARQGVVNGVDLRALSDRLKRLNEITDFLGLIQATMNGGQTAYSSFQGTFVVDKGIARSNDLLAVLDAAQGNGTALIDLPNWTIDMRTRARLTEHADSPQVGLDLTGPLDNPRRDVKTAELEQFLAQRGVGTLLRRLLPRDAQPQQRPSGAAPAPQTQPQQQQQQQQQQQRPRPEDILRGILRR